MKKRLIIAISVTAVLVIGSLAIMLTVSSAQTNAANSTIANNSKISGSIVIAWNKELLHPTRSFAIMHAAIYNAIVSITQDAHPYLFSVPASRNAQPDAAAAQAGHDTLLALYPKMKTELDQLLTDELAAIPNGSNKQEGIRVGHTAATRLLDIRANDGSSTTPALFVPGKQPGNYQLTPPKFAAPVFTNWGSTTPFVLVKADQFRPDPPPALNSAAYAQAINEVKSLGQNSSKTRTADQTVIAKFWGGPIWNTWNELAENSALAHHTNLENTARLFTVLNLSFADSAIAFYDAKYYYQLWRPVTAVREADTTGNPATVGDPNWTPLAATALDPTYPGAHSAISGAGAAVLSAFFGNQDQIRLTSDVLPGVVRTFTSYSDVATEAGLSRIYAGQHTRLDHEAGIKLGHNVAQFVLPRFGAQ